MSVNVLVSPYTKIAHFGTNTCLSERVSTMSQTLLTVAILLIIFYKMRPLIFAHDALATLSVSRFFFTGSEGSSAPLY